MLPLRKEMEGVKSPCIPWEESVKKKKGRLRGVRGGMT